MRKRKLKLSTKLVVTMLILVIGTIGFCWVLNSIFLEKYYSYNKQKEMQKGFDIISVACDKGELSSTAFDATFEQICTNGNIHIIIVDANRQSIRVSSNDMQDFWIQFESMRGNPGRERFEVLAQTDAYVLGKQTDQRQGRDSLVLRGILSDGSFIYMRTSLESLRETASISNWFFEIIAIVSVLVSLIIIIIISKNISRPIRELSKLSHNMSELKFENKYISDKRNPAEIDELGFSMNAMSSELENTITELKIANNELKQDILEKEKIDDMRKEFLSNVSHELKTPLALIQGYAEGLEECINDDEESRAYYCDVIMDEANKMNRMVAKLLSLNHLEFGNDKLEIARFDITELIDGIVKANNIMLAQKEVKLIFDNSKPVFVWGDEFKIEEVITNYLTNAINHVANEKIIDIKTYKKDNLIRISVFNTGNQIPEDEIQKVWIKFYKVDKARTREYGGSGIGLSIVKAIMDSHHMDCGAINRENGVEFWFELEGDR